MKIYEKNTLNKKKSFFKKFIYKQINCIIWSVYFYVEIETYDRISERLVITEYEGELL